VLFGGGVFDVFETLSELDFVVRVMVFCYILFWLYQTFIPARADLIFGLLSIVSGYLVFMHGVSITILVLLFMVFIVLGSQFQMLIQFGILPLFGYYFHGDRFRHVSEDQQQPQPQQGEHNAQDLANSYYSQGMSAQRWEALEKQNYGAR